MRRSRNKFGAVSTTIDGIKFPSKREANRYLELRLLEKAGIITHLELQPEFVLACGGTVMKTKTGSTMIYTADFRYKSGDVVVVEDAKGRDTRDSATRRAVVLAEYGITVELV